MTTANILNSLLLAAMLAGGSAHASDVATDGTRTAAQFKVGDSNCELLDGQIRCTLGK